MSCETVTHDCTAFMAQLGELIGETFLLLIFCGKGIEFWQENFLC